MHIKSSKIAAGAAVLAALSVGGTASAFTVVPFSDAPNDQSGINNTVVPAPGYPDFWSYNGSGDLSQAKHGGNFTFTYTDTYSARGCPTCAAVFNFPSGAYAVSNLSLTLTAIFAPSGQFLSGSYTIGGSLPPSSMPTYGSSPPGKSWTTTTSPLFTATLTGANVDFTHDALGFKTSSFGGWANQPQFAGPGPESIWIYSQLTCQTSNQSSPLCTANTNPSSNSSMSLWVSFLHQLKNDNLNVTGKFGGLAAIATVPLPGAVWLFGSGLVGLGGMLRRRRHKNVETA
jgi:hypothetical protein